MSVWRLGARIGVLALPLLFALPLWSAMTRVDPLFALPAIGAAAWAWPGRGWRSIGAAVLTVALAASIAVLLLAMQADLVQAGLMGLAFGLALWLHRLLDAMTRHWWRRLTRLGFALIWALAATAGLSAAYRPPAAAVPPVRLTIVTSLPLVWGAGDGDISAVLAGAAETPPIMRWLDRQFVLTHADALTPAALAATDVLLIAQPRLLDPASLVAIDSWVRGGGRALILADPALDWPPPFALGDPRNPERESMLAPLLARWGIQLQRGNGRTGAQRIVQAGMPLRLLSAGTLRGGRGCIASAQGSHLRCRIGQGRAVILADADFLHHRLWTLGDEGGSTDLLIAANPIWLADSINTLARRSPPALLIRPVWRR
jgi:hypothetical protein